MFGAFGAGVVYFFRVLDLLGKIIEEDVYVVAVGDLRDDATFRGRLARLLALSDAEQLDIRLFDRHFHSGRTVQIGDHTLCDWLHRAAVGGETLSRRGPDKPSRLEPLSYELLFADLQRVAGGKIFIDGVALTGKESRFPDSGPLFGPLPPSLMAVLAQRSPMRLEEQIRSEGCPGTEAWLEQCNRAALALNAETAEGVPVRISTFYRKHLTWDKTFAERVHRETALRRWRALPMICRSGSRTAALLVCDTRRSDTAALAARILGECVTNRIGLAFVEIGRAHV